MWRHRRQTRCGVLSHCLRDRMVRPETTPSFAERIAYRASVAVPSVT